MRSSLLAATLAITAVACMGCRARTPTSATRWGQPDRAMVLGLEADGEVVTAFIQNRGAEPQRIIARGVTLVVERPGWRSELYDHEGPTHLNRDSSFAVLEPGEALAIPIDVGARAIEPGTYSVTASYTSMTAAAGSWWYGVLEAGPIRLELR